MDAMTQYGVEEQEKLLSSLRTSKSNRFNLGMQQQVTMWRLWRQETAETKGELSREDVHDILQGMQDTTRMARSCRLTAERVARPHTAGNARKIIVWRGLASVGDL